MNPYGLPPTSPTLSEHLRDEEELEDQQHPEEDYEYDDEGAWDPMQEGSEINSNSGKEVADKIDPYAAFQSSSEFARKDKPIPASDGSRAKFIQDDIERHTEDKARDDALSNVISPALTNHSTMFADVGFIGFPGGDLQTTPIWNMSIFQQSLMLDVNPVSLNEQYYIVNNDPTNIKVYDGSSHMFARFLLPLLDALDDKGDERIGKLIDTSKSFLKDDPDSTKMLLRVPQMKRNCVDERRSEIFMEEENGDCRTCFAIDRPYVAQDVLTVPVNGRVVRYDKAEYNGDMLAGCKFRVCCVSKEGLQICLEVGYDNRKQPLVQFHTRISGLDGNLLKVSNPPADLVRKLLCIWEWKETDIVDVRLQCAKKYIPAEYPALIACTSGLSSKGCYESSAQLLASLVFNSIGPVLQYDLNAQMFWTWEPGTLWSPTQDRHKTIIRKTIRDLSEIPIKLLCNGAEDIFQKTLFAAAAKYRDLIQLPKPDNDQDKPEEDTQSAGGASTVTHGDSRVRSAVHDSGGDEVEEEEAGEEEAEEEEDEGDGMEEEEDEGVEMNSRQDNACKKGKKDKTETYEEKLEKISDKVRLGLEKRLVYSRNARCERAIEKLLIEAKDILAVRDLAKRLYKNRSLAFKSEVVTLDAPYSRHAATPQDMIRGRLPYDIGKIPETAEEIQQCEELVENFYMKFLHMDKASALREADKLAATLTGNQAILSQAGIRVHVGKYDPLIDKYMSRTGKNLNQTACIAILGHLIKHDLPPSVLSMVKEAGKAYSLFDEIENWLSIWIDEAQNRNAKNADDNNSFSGLNEGMVLGWIKGS